MTILTETEAKEILRLDTDTTYPTLNIVLPAVDAYLKTATGHDWAADDPKDPVARAAAQMLLVNWFENPGMVGSQEVLSFGAVNLIEQLRIKKLPEVPE